MGSLYSHWGSALRKAAADAVEVQHRNTEHISMSALVAAGEAFLVLQVPFQQSNPAIEGWATMKVRPDVEGEDQLQARISPSSKSQQYVFSEDFGHDEECLDSKNASWSSR